MFEHQNDKALAGKVAIVTGAGAGMGRAAARKLAGHGATLVLLDLSANALGEAEAELSPLVPCRTFPIDLADTDELEGMVGDIERDFGRIDILANVAARHEKDDTLDDIDAERWLRFYRVNVVAPAKLIQLVSRVMAARGQGGRIVNVSSGSSFRALGNPPAAYACSKGGLNVLTRVAAGKLGPLGINVNAVAPGVTRTGMSSHVPPETLDRMVSEGVVANLLRRVSEAEDVADVIVYLCLPGSRQITGQIIHTSAGLIV